MTYKDLALEVLRGRHVERRRDEFVLQRAQQIMVFKIVIVAAADL